MKVVVVGLGITGLSCVRFFAKRGDDVRTADTRENPPQLAAVKKEFPDLAIAAGELPEQWLLEADQIIVSPGLSIEHPALQKAQQAGIRIRGDIDVFAEFAKAPLLGITGSNGKGTVTSWVADMGTAAHKNFMACGNIGIPVLDILDLPVPDAYVMELSSFQLETTEYLPLKAAIILNITADHLDRYADMKAYTEAKQRIYRHCETAIFFRAQSETAPNHSVAQTLSFGLDEPKAGDYGVRSFEGEDWICCGNERVILCKDLSLRGRHNELNAMAACALGRAMGLTWEEMKKSLTRFQGLPHRCQFVVETKGVTWVNDSKATNVGATLAAIEGLAPRIKGKLVMILGGDGKGADFDPLLAPLKHYAREIVLLGKDADKLQWLLSPVLPVHRVETLKAAVETCEKLAQAGDMVLLSPACSSLDMFKNYEARGEAFSQYAKELGKG